MQINRKTRNINKYLSHVQNDQSYFLGWAVDDGTKGRLRDMGFTLPLLPGQRLLPSGKRGAASRRNANGFDVIHRDQPKERAYRQIEWSWTQFVGRDETEEVTRIVDVPYLRYPRTNVPPYSIELEIRARSDGRFLVVAGPFVKNEASTVLATNTANMLREIFGGFEVFDETLSSWVNAPIRRLNWQLLPPGKNPWESAVLALKQIIARAPAGNQNVLFARLEAVGSKKPDFVAIGMGGFDGYTVFGFAKQNMCVLESPQVNNATYVLPLESWERISQMTKAEILSSNAHKARILHTRSWFASIDRILEIDEANELEPTLEGA